MAVNIQTIRSSFDLVKPIANQVADRFYDILFTDYPQAKPLFRNVDMAKQKSALISALSTTVANLDKPDVLMKTLLGLGERHAKYGTEELHYNWVGSSLLKAFQQSLGTSWSPELEDQWAEVYAVVAEAMKAGAKKANTTQRQFSKSTPPAIDKVDRNSAVKMTQSSESDLEPSLPNHIKEHIRMSVDRVVQALIKKEVQRCLDEQMKTLSELTPEELVKKAG